MTDSSPEHENQQRRQKAALLLLPAGLLASLCCIWSLFANVGQGEAEAFIPAPLHSSARANYSEDSLLGRMQSLSISIVESAMRDRDPEAQDIEARATEVYMSMKTAVPTVPSAQTATPSRTPTSTRTPLPTATLPPSASPSATPTGTLTATSTASPSPTPSKTPTKTPSKTPTPSPCKVKPVLQINDPIDGSSYDWADELMGEARAYDPDNVDVANCQPIGSFTADNGTGISKIEFKIIYEDGGNVVVHEQDQLSVRYCAFTGTTTCNTHSLGPPFEWPGGATIGSGQYELHARAKDDEGQWSEWTHVHFTVDVDPTPTPSNTPMPSSTPTPSNTPTPSPTPTVNPCTGIGLTNFNKSGNEAWWDLSNGPAGTIEINLIQVTWTHSTNLKQVKLAGTKIWEDDWASPVTITADWRGSTADRSVAAGATAQFLLQFASGADPSGWDLTVGFTNGCTADFNN